MLKKVLMTSVVLIGALLIVEMTSQALVAWAMRPTPDTQGKLIEPHHHWVDRPEVGVIV